MDWQWVSVCVDRCVIGGGVRIMSCAQVMYQPYVPYLSYDRSAAAAAASASSSADAVDKVKSLNSMNEYEWELSDFGPDYDSFLRQISPVTR